MVKRSDNDKKIQKMFKEVEAKRAELGPKPKIAMKTTGLFLIDNSRVNLHTINTLKDLVTTFSRLLLEKIAFEKAAETLGVEGVSPTVQRFDFEDIEDDFKNRAAFIRYNERKKVLDKMDVRLKQLLSEEASVSHELEELKKLL